MADVPQKTIYWYDYETFGATPRVDRLAQFGGVRTDEALNIIGAPLMLYCKLADDYLPQPISSLITGITPQKVNEVGLPEVAFIRRIHAEFSQPNTCVTGYNNLRFDDEFTRYSLYRNFLDPYGREWRNGNSRWDLVDVVRLTRALRPEGIVWPNYDDGRPSLRLEDLTVANQISHTAAHDALSDVYATIALARLIRDQQPKLYDYVFQHRFKNSVLTMLNLKEQKPVIHVSGMYPTERGNMAVVIPVAAHPTNKNGVIVYDLSQNPEPLFKLKPEKIHERIFTATEDLPKGVERIPLKTVHANKCPVVVPFTTLTSQAAKRYGIDINLCKSHLDMIIHGPPLREKIQKVFSVTEFEARSDPDDQLYGGPFFNDDDRQRMNHIHTLSPQELVGYTPSFSDPRLEEMLFRYRARNFPESLTTDEKMRWQAFRAARFTQAEPERLTATQYFAELTQLQQVPERTAAELQILDALYLYGQQLTTPYRFD